MKLRKLARRILGRVDRALMTPSERRQQKAKIEFARAAWEKDAKTHPLEPEVAKITKVELKLQASAAKKRRDFHAKDMVAISPQAQTGANAQYVKDQYEKHWGSRLDTVERMIDEGESMAHILTSIRPPAHNLRGYNRVAGWPAVDYLTPRGLSEDKDGVPNIRLAVAAARYTAVPNFDPFHVLHQLAKQHKNIVELGAGPGWNLFDMAIRLGKAVQTKRLFGLEYTDAGVSLMTRLAERESLPMAAHPFDYTAPDLSCVPDDGETLFFSHHSIEQVEDISDALYAQMLARKHASTLVHCEPIGWQRFKDLLQARMSQDYEATQTIAEGRRDNIDTERTQAINAALNSWRTGYNRNALGLLDKLSDHAQVEEIGRIYDFTHARNANPVTPSTYIELRITPYKALSSTTSASP